MSNQRGALGPALLALFTFGVFSSALGNGFLNWDDVIFLHGNRAVLDFDLPVLLRQRVVGIYHPVTMLSLALEHRLFGLDPFWFHLDNVLLHALNAVLVVLLLRRLCPEEPFVPLLAGVLFAIHPLRAESVAWVSERKDLLSVLFFLATVLAHLRFRDTNRWRWYVAALALYVLAILSKPMAVTAPLVLWISDWRIAPRPAGRALLELSPFLVLAGAVGVASVLTQAHHPEEQVAIYEIGLSARFGVALQSLVFYVSKTLVPLNLSGYYDFDQVRIEPYRFVVAATFLVWLAWAAVRPSDARPNYRFAALFFLVTVAPVLKLLPFGGHSLFNDRYTYLPGIGLVFALALPFRSLGSWRAPTRAAAIFGLAAILLVLAAASHERAKVWRTSETFWLDVLRKYPGTAVALNNLGLHYLDAAGDLDRARAAFEEATRARPDYARAWLNLGILHERRGDREAANRDFERALELAPYDADFQVRIGLFQHHGGEHRRAIDHYRAAIALQPEAPLAYHNLAVAYRALGEIAPAKAAFERTIELAPNLGEPRAGLAEILLLQGDRRGALTSYEAARERGTEVDAALIEKLRRQLAGAASPS